MSETKNKSKKILIIDDNEEITGMLEKFLKMEGFDITSSNDGQNGLNLIKEKSFDTVLLDLAMPDFNGEDVLNELKNDEIENKQKIIIFTASSVGDEKISKLKKQGAHSCIRKPVKIPELVKLLNSD